MSKLEKHEIDSNESMNASAQEIFDRLLSSFDPIKAEGFLDQSIVRKKLEHKAALYDAMCEKYEQICEYHENGRLLKDFRREYRKNLKS